PAFSGARSVYASSMAHPARESDAGQRGDRPARQRIHPLVEGITAMAFDLGPHDVVTARLGDQPFPEVSVGDRHAVRAAPAALLPSLVPAVAEAVHDALSV